jgi:hypothetical protein
MTTRIDLLQRAAILPAVLLLAHCSSAPDSEPPDSSAGGAAGTTAAAGSSQATAGSEATAGAGGSINAGGGTKSSGGKGGTDPTSGSPAGGALTSGGASGLGGAAGAGGNQPQAGATAGGSSGQAGTAGTGGADPNDKTIPMTIPTPTNGQGEIRSSTTVLKNAKNGGKDIWDFGNQRIGVNNTADCEDGEGQLTVFEVEDGITVRNLIIPAGLPAGNGIVCKGNCNLEYVYWEDVCEDAATNSKDGATMRLNHVIALKATDKVFQHNAKGGSRTIIENSFVSGFGKLWRSCGDCTDNGGPRHLTIDNVRVDGVTTAVAGANQNYGDTVTIKSLFVKGGYDAADDKPKICTEYLGVTDHNGESTKLGDGKSQWNTATCKVTQSEVKSY